MTELERYKRAVAHLKLQLEDKHCSFDAYQEMFRTVDAILNPLPEMEEVEVVRWMCTTCDETYDFRPVTSECGAKLNEHGGECNGTEYVKLTGTFQRPKPQPVERSVSVDVRVKASSGGDKGQPILPSGYYATFQDFPECHGKTGTLTFTWTE